MRRSHLAFGVLVLMACASGGDATLAPPTGSPAAGPKVAAKGKVDRSAAEAIPPPPSVPLREEDFTTTRDPFHPEGAVGSNDETGCTPTERQRSERTATVAFGDEAVSSLVVRGTVSGVDGHAIIADGRGSTRVIAVGSPIGRWTPDARGACREWRVDRVRDGEVVLAEVGGPASEPQKTMVLGGARS